LLTHLLNQPTANICGHPRRIMLKQCAKPHDLPQPTTSI
jgi:hypothetical protein